MKLLARKVFTAVAILLGTSAHAQIIDYSMPALNHDAWGKKRTFNFNSDLPLRNPITGEADIGQIQYNGVNINGASIVDVAGCEADVTSRICRYQESAPTGSWVTRVKLREQDAATAGSYRTQLNSYYIETQKRYIVDFEFRLDADWDFGMPHGAGLIWQLKNDVHTDYQYGNPVLGINLYGDQLQFDIKYPNSAAGSQVWPMSSVPWVANDYVDAEQPKVTVTKGEFHRVQLIFYADDTPKNSFITSGKGFILALFDGKPWFEYEGPTLQPDSLNPHKISWGWYQWQGKPLADRIIYYRKHQVYEWQ